MTSDLSVSFITPAATEDLLKEDEYAWLNFPCWRASTPFSTNGEHIPGARISGEPLVDAPYPTQLSLDSSPISPTSGSGRERRHSSGSAVSPTSSMRGEISRRNSGIRRPVSRQRAERIGRLASPTRPSLINTYTSSETPLADSPILGNIQISSSVQQQCCKYKEGNFSLPLIRYLNDPSYTTPGFTSACARVSVHDHDPLNCRIEEVEPEREMVEEGWERARRVVEACGKVVDLDVNAGEGRGFEK